MACLQPKAYWTIGLLLLEIGALGLRSQDLRSNLSRETRDVRLWHKADIDFHPEQMPTFGGNADIFDTPYQCPLMTQSGH